MTRQRSTAPPREAAAPSKLRDWSLVLRAADSSPCARARTQRGPPAGLAGRSPPERNEASDVQITDHAWTECSIEEGVVGRRDAVRRALPRLRGQRRRVGGLDARGRRGRRRAPRPAHHRADEGLQRARSALTRGDDPGRRCALPLERRRRQGAAPDARRGGERPSHAARGEEAAQDDERSPGRGDHRVASAREGQRRLPPGERDLRRGGAHGADPTRRRHLRDEQPQQRVVGPGVAS